MMNIVFCTDNNLIKQAAILLKSILLSNHSSDIHFFALLLNVDKINIELLNKTVGDHAKLTIYEIGNDIILPTINSGRISIGTYLRFLIEKKLPPSLHKVLYLDVDIVVIDSIQSLYDTDLTNYSVGAAYDVECGDIRRYNRLSYPFHDGYFNAGVLLINLDYWRKNNISEKALDFVLKNSELCKFHDQDALNHILHGSVFYISSRYNVIYDFLRLDNEKLLIEREKYEKIKQDLKTPVVIHYAGVFKPWDIEYHTFKYPFGNVYIFFIKLTNVKLPFTHWKPNIVKKFKIKHLIRKLFVAMHIIASDSEMKRHYYEDTLDIETQIIHKFQV